jgi:hypothetical protein
MKIEHKQIRVIKALQRALSMDEDTYRAMLGGFRVESCTELTQQQAADLINRLMADAVKTGRWVKSYFRAGRVHTLKKWDELGTRVGMATPAQLRLIEVVWRDVTRYTDPVKIEQALQHFCAKRFKRDDITKIEKWMVPKVMTALYAMKRQTAVPTAPDDTHIKLENR